MLSKFYRNMNLDEFKQNFNKILQQFLTNLVKLRRNLTKIVKKIWKNCAKIKGKWSWLLLNPKCLENLRKNFG